MDFTDAGSKKFAEDHRPASSSRPRMNQFAIVLDGEVVSAPVGAARP